MQNVYTVTMIILYIIIFHRTSESINSVICILSLSLTFAGHVDSNVANQMRHGTEWRCHKVLDGHIVQLILMWVWSQLQVHMLARARFVRRRWSYTSI